MAARLPPTFPLVTAVRAALIWRAALRAPATGNGANAAESLYCDSVCTLGPVGRAIVARAVPLR